MTLFQYLGDISSIADERKCEYKLLFETINNKLPSIGLNKNQMREVYQVIAAIILLGNIEFQTSDDLSYSKISKISLSASVAILLGISQTELEKMLLFRSIKAKTNGEDIKYEIIYIFLFASVQMFCFSIIVYH